MHDVLGGEVEVGEDAGERVHQLGDGKQVGSGHDGVHGQELIASVRPDERSVKWRVKPSQLTAESSKTGRTGRNNKRGRTNKLASCAKICIISSIPV